MPFKNVIAVVFCELAFRSSVAFKVYVLFALIPAPSIVLVLLAASTGAPSNVSVFRDFIIIPIQLYRIDSSTHFHGIHIVGKCRQLDCCIKEIIENFFHCLTLHSLRHPLSLPPARQPVRVQQAPSTYLHPMCLDSVGRLTRIRSAVFADNVDILLVCDIGCTRCPCPSCSEGCSLLAFLTGHSFNLIQNLRQCFPVSK